MKSLSVTPSTIDFGKQSVGNKRSKSVLITNTGTENCELVGIATKGAFSSDLVAKTIPPAYPASSTLYFVNVGGKAVMQNADGSYSTTDQGFGRVGTTNSEGKLTINLTLGVLTITSYSFTEGVTGTISGGAVGVSTVNVFYKVHSSGTWLPFQSGISVVAGNWTASGIVTPAGNYDFKVEDASNIAVFSSVENVVVASAQVDGEIMYQGPSDDANSNYSTDYGDNFSHTDNVGVAVKSIASIADGSWAYYAAYAKVMKITSAGVSSTLLTLAGKWLDKILCSDDGKYAILIVQVDGVYVTSDYGANWTQHSAGDNISDIFCSWDGQNMGYVMNFGNVYFSNDYGSNFTARSSAKAWTSCCSSADGTTVYATVYTDTIYKFTNNGATISSFVTASNKWRDIACSHDGSVILVTGNPYAIVSINSGTSFSLIYTGDVSGSTLAVSPDGGKALFCTIGGVTYLSTTPHTSRSQISGDTSAAWGIPFISNDNKTMIVGGRSGIYTTKDSGANWTDNATTYTGAVCLNNKNEP